MNPMMLRITAPDRPGRLGFCAGIVPGGMCAHILSWMNRKRWSAFQIKEYCRGKGWECDEL